MMCVYFRLLILALAVLSLAGCVSDTPQFDRISSRLPFIKQFGLFTQPLSSSTTSGNDVCDDIFVDRYENIYCSGYTTSDYGETSTGGTDAFVMKMNKAGKVLWVRQLGTQSSLIVNAGIERCWQLAVDRDLNVYCGGDVSAGFQVGLPGLPATAPPYGGTDIFAMKLNPQGEIQWLRQYGSTGNEGCYNMTVARDGSLYCAGSTTAQFESGAGIGGTDAYIMKILPSDGTVVWTRQLGPSNIASRLGSDASGPDSCGALAEDSAGDLWCAGRTNVLVNASTSVDLFLWKVSPTGETKSLKQYSAPEYSWSLNSTESGVDIVFHNGSMFVGGSTTGTFLDVNDFPIASDAVMWKINPSTLEPDWVTQIGESVVGDDNNSKGEVCTSIVVSSRNEAYCAGNSKGNLGDINPDATVTTDDIFIIKFNSGGSVDKLIQFGTSAQVITGKSYSGDDKMGAITIDTSDNIYMGAHTYGNFQETRNGVIDALIFRLGPDLNISDLSP